MQWNTGDEYRQAQKSVVLPAGTAAHVSVSVRYIDVGTDKNGTVAFLHGIPTWGYLYAPILTTFVDAGYRVIVPDLLGHGWSDRRDCFDRSFQDQARMFRGLLSVLSLDRVDVVGHDTGGAVALILAIEHSARVRRLVLANTVCYDRFDDDMLDFGHPLRWKSRSVSELVEALEESLAAGLSQEGRLTREFREGIIAPYANEEGKLSLLRNASALNANQTMALVDRHATVISPTLVLWGEDDPWQKVEDGRQLASEIPAATFRLIEHASHWVQQDKPEEFAAAILAFFEQNEQFR